MDRRVSQTTLATNDLADGFAQESFRRSRSLGIDLVSSPLDRSMARSGCTTHQLERTRYSPFSFLASLPESLKFVFPPRSRTLPDVA